MPAACRRLPGWAHNLPALSFQGIQRQCLAAMGRRQSPGHVGVQIACRRHELQTVHLRHLHVGHDYIGGDSFIHAKACGAVLGLRNLPAGLLSQQLGHQSRANRQRIDNNEHVCHERPSFADILKERE